MPLPTQFRATICFLAAGIVALAFSGCLPGQAVVTISPMSSSLEINETLQFTASSSLEEDIVWSSDQPDVVAVDENGLATALRPGTANVAAIGVQSGASATAAIAVQGEPVDESNTPDVVRREPTDSSEGVPQVEVELASGETFLLDDPGIWDLLGPDTFANLKSADYDRSEYPATGPEPDRSTDRVDPVKLKRSMTGMANKRPSAQRISLHADQTPIRNQGPRGLCVVHAVLGAVEAQYNREGFGELDLSEHYLQHVFKTRFLHNFVDNGDPHTANNFENFLAVGGGGNVYGALPGLLKYPTSLESLRPYISDGDYGNGNQMGDDPMIQWDDRDGSETQFEVNTFNPIQEQITIQKPGNLTLTPLPQNAVENAVYGITGYQTVPNERLRDATWYEEQISMNREVIFACNFISDTRDGIMYPDDKGPNQGDAGHAMLIIGYDRTDSDDPYFIVKNSWGGSGYLKWSYDWLTTDFDGRITQAAVITGVRDPNQTGFRPSLFLGRWKLMTNGVPSRLDIHRDSGYYEDSRLGGQEDNRLGAIIESGTQNVFRVNGDIRDEDETADREISFWANAAKPALDYEEQSGTNWIGYLDNDDWTLTAGIATDPSGTERPWYAVKGDFFNGVAVPGVLGPDSFFGAWAIEHPEIDGRLEINSVNPGTNQFSGRYIPSPGNFIIVDGTEIGRAHV